MHLLLVGHDYITRRKDKGILQSTYNRILLKQHSLSNVLGKSHNWLKSSNLIPDGIWERILGRRGQKTGQKYKCSLCSC